MKKLNFTLILLPIIVVCFMVSPLFAATVTLTWNQPNESEENITEWEVFWGYEGRGGNGEEFVYQFNPTTNSELLVTEKTCVIENVDNGKQTFYAVRAKSGEVRSFYSEEVSTTIPLSSPSGIQINISITITTNP